MNKVLPFLPTEDITETKTLIPAVACYIGDKLDLKKRMREGAQEPMWKRQMRKKIDELRGAVRTLQRKQKGEIKKRKGVSYIERKYHVKKEGIETVIEELQQRIVALAARMERCTNRGKQYRQNKLFETNQRRLYQELNRENMSETVAPDAEQSKEFWSGIWDDPVTHNASTEWLKDVQNEMSGVGKQQNIVLSTDKLKLQLRKVPNWNGSGPDVVQGYWIKYLTPFHERIVAQLNTILSTACVLHWMTTGRTVWCMKDPGKSNAVDNYRLISCLPVMWKVFSGMLAEEIYEYLEGKNLFPHEQKGCKKKSRGTKDQLLIDKTILRNCKNRKVNLAMAWIDYSKAYDMIPHSWILDA